MAAGIRPVPPAVMPTHRALPLRAGAALDPQTFAGIRRRAILEGCKWDPQVGDVSTLASFPLLLRRSEWRRLSDRAEELTRETLAAEVEVMSRPELINELGLPRALRQALRGSEAPTLGTTRTMRFDFHFTTDGWRLSEVNSDVPGGFIEASFFTARIAEQFPRFTSTGDTAGVWADSVARTAGRNGVVAMLAAPGYMEDQQIMVFLAARLRERGCAAFLATPSQVRWRDGLAHLETSWHRGPVNALVRFYQGEWLSRLPRRFGWEHFLRGGRTPVTNPGSSVISESKRFPLLWDRLRTPMPAWRELLPETRDPHDAPWLRNDGWLVKSAFSNTGDDVSIRGLLTSREWRGVRWSVFFEPGCWLAQRRFESVPVPTPLGPMHVCVGVYTIDGCATGSYTRLSPKPLIDYSAVDVALLLEDDDE